MNNSLKLAATINIVAALLAHLAIEWTIYPLLLIILSVIYFSYSGNTISYLKTKNTSITIMGIINFFLNPISGLIVLIGKDKISTETETNEKEEIQELSTEDKRISISLNLGIALVSISGIILATTNWNLMSNILKISILLLISLIFIFLSMVCEKKLKIEILSKNYWLISMFFMILTVIANGYLEVTSNWFSFFGEGKYLYIAMTSIITSLLSLITSWKYKKTIYKNISYIGIIASISAILRNFNISIEVVLILITSILIILNTIKSEKLTNINELAKYGTIILSALSLIILTDTNSLMYLLILAILTIINTIVAMSESTDTEGIIATIIINIASIIAIVRLPELSEITEEIASVIMMTLYSLYYLINIIKTNKFSNAFKISMNITSNFIMALLLMINYDNKIILTLLSTMVVLTSLTNYYKNAIKSEKLLLPIKLIVFIISLIGLLKDVINIDLAYILIIIYLISFVIYKLAKTERTKTISLIIYFVMFAIALLNNVNKELIPSIINLASASSIFLLMSEEKNNKKTIASYIMLLLTIYAIFAHTNILVTTLLNNGIIILLIYALLTILTNDNKKLNKISYLSIILPLVVMSEDYSCTYEITEIIETSIALYVVALICIFLMKNDKDRNVLSTILSSLILVRIITTDSWIIGLYVGIIGLIITIIGLIKKEYKGLFIEGIIVTILNLLYQFKYIFEDLPLWIYTLVAGLIIIAIVTYKAVKDKEKNKEE